MTFAVMAVKEWNKLPTNIRSSQNVKLFKNNYVNYLKESYVGLDHFSIPLVKLYFSTLFLVISIV